MSFSIRCVNSYDTFWSVNDQEIPALKNPVGKVPRNWFNGIDSTIAELLVNRRVNRDDLKNMCRDKNVRDDVCAITILAWGGMRVGHGRQIWSNNKDEWIKIVRALRQRRLDRKEAYSRFHEFRKSNPGCGMGPAYYTKLIFFASPEHNGYIMDQWTARSINLMLVYNKSPIVKLRRSVNNGRISCWVTDENTAEDYERFCLAVECLANKARHRNWSAEDIEARMFSYGGINPGAWRKYVQSENYVS